MSILKIITEPDPVLRKKCKLVEKIDKNLKLLMDNMAATMYEAPGIGLAAIQVGVLRRVIVIDTTKEEEIKKPLFLINPEIISKSKNKATYEEGCLSLPKQYAEIERPESILVQYINEKNEIIEEEKNGFEARVLQHEIDHLNGKLFIDYLSSLKRNMLIKRVQKLKKMGEI